MSGFSPYATPLLQSEQIALSLAAHEVDISSHTTELAAHATSIASNTSAVANRTAISAKDYGAAGDGTTDDTTALRDFATALAALATALVVPPHGVIPEGEYLITDTVRFGSCHLSGQGKAKITLTATPTINSGGTKAALIFDDGAGGGTGDVTLEGVEVEYIRPETLLLNSVAVDCVFIRSDARALVRDVEAHGATYVGVEFYSANLLGTGDCTHDGVYAHDCGYSGGEFNGRDGVILPGCRYANNGGWNGIDGYGATFHNQFVHVDGAHFENCFSQHIDCHGFTKTAIIVGNKIVFGTFTSTVGNGITLANQVETYIVEGNSIDGANIAQTFQGGINASGLDNWYPANARVQIKGNQIFNFIDYSYGIGLNAIDCDVAIVEGNTVDNCDPTHPAITVRPSGAVTLPFCHRQIPRALRVENNNALNSGPIQIDVAQELFLSGNLFRYTRHDVSAPVGAFVVGLSGTKTHIGTVRIDRPNTVHAPPSCAAYYGPSVAIFSNAVAPAYFTWAAGTTAPNTGFVPGDPTGFLCTTAGTPETVTATTATTTAASRVVDLIADASHLMPGDVIAIAGESFGTGKSPTATVLSVDDIGAYVSTVSGSAVLTVQSSAPTQAALIFAAGDRLIVGSTTFGGAAFATILSIATGGLLTMSHSADSTHTSGSPVLAYLNRCTLDLAANVGVSAASLTWQAAAFRRVASAATSTSMGLMSGNDRVEQSALSVGVAQNKRRVVNFNDPVFIGSTSATLDFSDTLPTNARIMGAEVSGTLLSGGAVSSVKVDLGFAGDTTALLAQAVVGPGAALPIGSPLGTNPRGKYGGSRPRATFTSVGANLNALTAGALNVDIAYWVEQAGLWLPTSADGCSLDLWAAKSLTANAANGVTELYDQIAATEFYAVNSEIPTFVPEATNGQPEILFNGLAASGNDLFSRSATATADLIGTGDWAIFVVGTVLQSRTNVSGAFSNEAFLGDLSGRLSLAFRSNGSFYPTVLSGAAVKMTATGATYTVGTRAIFHARLSGGTLFGGVNLGTETSVACGAMDSGSSYIEIGRNLGASASAFSNIRLQRVVAYKRAAGVGFSLTEAQAVINGLNARAQVF